jgi:hypothetical protein
MMPPMQDLALILFTRKKFEVLGAQGETVVYLFDLNLGYEFPVSA